MPMPDITWMPHWAQTVVIIGHIVTTILGFVYLIVRDARRGTQFNNHMKVCHPEQIQEKKG